MKMRSTKKAVACALTKMRTVQDWEVIKPVENNVLSKETTEEIGIEKNNDVAPVKDTEVKIVLSGGFDVLWIVATVEGLVFWVVDELEKVIDVVVTVEVGRFELLVLARQLPWKETTSKQKVNLMIYLYI